MFSLYPSWNWYKLPQAYLESAYMSTDQQSLDNFFKRSVECNDEDINFDTHNKDDDDGPGSDNANPGSDMSVQEVMIPVQEVLSFLI